MTKILLTLLIPFALLPRDSTASVSTTSVDFRKAAVMNKCMDKRTCRFHLVGAGSATPKGVFSVTPEAWSKFNEIDKLLVPQYAKLWLEHAYRNPVQALTDKVQGAGMSPQAPILPAFARNVQNNLRTVEFLVAASKMKDGTPGWSEGTAIKELTVTFTPGR